MDLNIARWTLEFLLRQNLTDESINKLLKSLTAPKNNLKLNKAILLRSIESEVVNNNNNRISEKILELFERIEAIEDVEGKGNRVLDSMKVAYCALAVECTVRHLSDRGKFCRSVERIWRGRLRVMEESGKSRLVSRELRVWRERIEAAAVSGSGISGEVLNWDRNEVVRIVKVYLDEAWVIMGPSFLELAGEAMGLAREVGSEGRESLVKMMCLVKRASGVGENLVQRESSLGDENGALGDGVLEKEQNALNSKWNSIAEVGNSRVEREVSLHNVVKSSSDGHLVRDRGVSKVNVPSNHKYVASHRRAKRGAKIARVEELDTGTLHSEFDTIASPEVIKVQEELRNSYQELQAVVKDPLPDALHKADSIRSGFATKHMNIECEVESRGGRDADVPNSGVHGGVEPQTSKASTKSQAEGGGVVVPIPSGNEGVDPVLTNGGTARGLSNSPSNVSKRSLMERNSTAHVYEWDDSIDNSPEGTSKRMKLPTPPRPVVSPLKKYASPKISRRRRIKRWSNLEEDTLRTGVQRFGKGNWKLILNAYRDIFEERTEVDLKDKWRNMTR